MSSSSEAEAAKEAMHDTDFKGRNLNIDELSHLEKEKIEAVTALATGKLAQTKKGRGSSCRGLLSFVMYRLPRYAGLY